MTTIKLLHVAGTRPNFMKIAPVMRAVRAWNSEHGTCGGDVVMFDQVLVHTGQHHDHVMSDVFIGDLGMDEPDYRLKVSADSPIRQTAEIMVGLEGILTDEQPDLVVVVGDVNSTLAAAQTAAKLGFPVAHVEAGLRSRDRAMPEETNRILTDHLSDLLFATCEDAVDNLRVEGIIGDGVILVGNPMIDSLEACRTEALGRGVLRELDVTAGNYVLATLHRPSNVDDPGQLSRLCKVLGRLAADLPIVFPVHTRTRLRLSDATEGDELLRAADVRIVPPLGYLDFLALMAQARLVLTDSGGVQEETTVLGVPCITVRTTTERPVTVAEGTNKLVDPCDGPGILDAARAVISQPAGCRGSRRPRLWDGHAAGRIVAAIADWAELRAAGPAPDAGYASARSDTRW